MLRRSWAGHHAPDRYEGVLHNIDMEKATVELTNGASCAIALAMHAHATPVGPSNTANSRHSMQTHSLTHSLTSAAGDTKWFRPLSYHSQM